MTVELRRTLSFLFLACVIFPPLVQASPTSVEVFADGVDGVLIPVEGSRVRIPHGTKAIVFRIGDNLPSGENEGARRVQHMLEGVNAGWVQRPSDMSLYVYFYDQQGNRVSHESFMVKGRSSGWGGSVENSTFTHRRETLVVPPGASTVNVVFSSAGPPSAIGVYVIEDVVLSRAAKPDALAEAFWGSRSFLNATDEEYADGLWKRDGTNASMSQVIELGDEESPRAAFCIFDDDPTAHAEWRSVEAPRVQPGEILTLDWNEFYDIGVADRFEASYAVMPPGDYVFRVQEVDTVGQPVGPENRLQVTVTPPFWKMPWFLAGGVCLIGGVAAVITHYVARARIRKRFQRMHQEHMVERERLRIARDIHDDLGARLTHISLVSAMASKDELPLQAATNFKRISAMTREMVAALYETVWTVNPENDCLDSLVSFLCQSIHNLCGTVGIRCRLDTAPIEGSYPVTSEIRHNVSLAVKEAIHNAIKHANATEVQAQIRFESGRLSILIADNGQGFFMAENLEFGEGGHGMKNMRERMHAVRGSMHVESVPGEGTKVSFEVPIPQTS